MASRPVYKKHVLSWSYEFVNFSVNSSPTSLKKDGNSPSGVAASYLLRKPTFLITSTTDGGLGPNSKSSFARRSERPNGTVGQLNCFLKYSTHYYICSHPPVPAVVSQALGQLTYQRLARLIACRPAEIEGIHRFCGLTNLDFYVQLPLNPGILWSAPVFAQILSSSLKGQRRWKLRLEMRSAIIV